MEENQDENKQEFVAITNVKEFFLYLIQDETMQNFLIRHFCHSVVEGEMSRRKSIETLLCCDDLAKILNISTQGLYKKLQNNDLDIPYIPLGRGGGYRFNPIDVKEWLTKNKKRPVKRPDSLKRRIK
jgi:hypothetical protein